MNQITFKHRDFCHEKSPDMYFSLIGNRKAFALSVTLDPGGKAVLPAAHLGSLAVPPAFHEQFLSMGSLTNSTQTNSL